MRLHFGVCAQGRDGEDSQLGFFFTFLKSK